MEALRVVTGRTVPIMHDSIDTDQLLPKQFLKRLTRTGYGESLFYEWRYDHGQPKQDFILNQPERQGASILVTGNNFGIGSSREHAVWALKDWGFRVIIAGSFGPILYMNCTKNGVLPIEQPQVVRNQLAKLLPTDEVTIDLPNQVIRRGQHRWHFDINPSWKEKFINGEDDIDQTLKYASQIAIYEKKMAKFQ